MRYQNHYIVWHNHGEGFQNGFSNVYTTGDKASVMKDCEDRGYIPTDIRLISTDWTFERCYRVSFADEADPSMVLYFYSYTELMNHLSAMFANCKRPIEVVEVNDDGQSFRVFVMDDDTMYIREKNDYGEDGC